MGQRLGIAATLLGDPATLILDEPVNGLDPDGILWIRNLLKDLAAEGRTVLVSSHLMSEMALTAEHLIVIGKGRLIADMPIAEMIAAASRASVAGPLAPTPRELAELLPAPTSRIRAAAEPCGLRSRARPRRRSVTSPRANGIAIHELTPQRASLEEAFMKMTNDRSNSTVEHGRRRSCAGAGKQRHDDHH